MNDQHTDPTTSLRWMPRDDCAQLDLDFGEMHIPPGPDWESLPEASRSEAMTMLARLLAKAGTDEEETDA